MVKQTCCKPLPQDVIQRYLMQYLPPAELRRAACCCREWNDYASSDSMLSTRLLSDMKWSKWEFQNDVLNDRVRNDLQWESPEGIQRRILVPILKGINVLAATPVGSKSTSTLVLAAAIAGWDHPEQIKSIILVSTREVSEYVKTIYKQLTRNDTIMNCLIGTPTRILSDVKKRSCDRNQPSATLSNVTRILIDAWALTEGFYHTVRELCSYVSDKASLTILISTPVDPGHLSLMKSRCDIDSVLRYDTKEFRGSSNFFINQKLTYQVSSDKVKSVSKLLSVVETPCIVFVNHQKKADYMTRCLLQSGHVVCMVHEEMRRRDRELSVSIFLSSSIQVMCLTYLSVQDLVELNSIKTIIHATFEPPESYVSCLTCDRAAARTSIFMLDQSEEASQRRSLQEFFDTDITKYS